LLNAAQLPTLESSLLTNGLRDWNGLRAAVKWKVSICMGSSGQALPERSVAESQSEMTELILPNDTNTLGNLLGGRLMHFIDLVGAMAAYRHSRTHVVTASMEHIDFIAPVHVGDLLILKSSVNRAFRTSMEVGVKVWAENTLAGMHRHVASAYLTFVAVDPQERRVPVPPVQPETESEKRRFDDAGRRREIREQEAARRRAAKPAELAGQGSVRPGRN
jgi:acyl-CoA hydrolase